MKPYYQSNGVTIYVGDCREIMPTLDPVHAIICDPPYGLEFMGKEWDAPWKTDRRQRFDGTLKDDRDTPHGRSKVRGGQGASYGADAKIMQALQEWYYSWAIEALRVLRPGGHLLSFGGSRTYHRMACAIEDAGFEIRDQIMWLYGSGFPKSLDVSKAIDKAAGVEREVVGVNTNGSGPNLVKLANHGTGDTGVGYMDGSGKVFDVTVPSTDAAKQWDGWGTALKPAHEPICVARKPIEGTVAANVLKHGTGALNIDGCRIETSDISVREHGGKVYEGVAEGYKRPNKSSYTHKTDYEMPALGRWPANIIHDGSEEVVSLFPSADGQQGDILGHNKDHQSPNGCFGKMAPAADHLARLDSGSAARFFYTAKADKNERGTGNTHPTVKPIDLMAYLCKLLCPPSGGILLDPFMGSGSTIIAGRRFFQHCIGIELNEKYAEMAVKRLSQEVIAFEGAETV